MYLNYGNYLHALGEAAVVITRTPRYNEGGERRSVMETWQITGMLMSDNANDLSGAIAALQQAYSQDGGNLRLLFDDGTPTSHVLYSSSTIGGTRVVGGVSWPESGATSAEYTTFRTYSITVEGEVPTNNVNLLAYNERLSFKGTCGPLIAYLPVIVGIPPAQTVAQATTQKITQRGSAVGYFSYVTPNPPIYPAVEIYPERDIDWKDPKRSGPVGFPNYTEWEVTWSYTFETNVPLLGFPYLWPGN